jgi:hypothetical protein
MHIHIICIRVISLTTGKLVPDLTRTMERTAIIYRYFNLVPNQGDNFISNRKSIICESITILNRLREKTYVMFIEIYLKEDPFLRFYGEQLLLNAQRSNQSRNCTNVIWFSYLYYLVLEYSWHMETTSHLLRLIIWLQLIVPHHFFKCLYQARKVSGHVFVCNGYRCCLFLLVGY